MEKTKRKTDYIPAYIGPFTLRTKPKTLYRLQCMINNSKQRCKNELAKYNPLPDDKVTNDPIAKPFSMLQNQRKKAYARVSAIENYKSALVMLNDYVEWLREVTANPEDPWFAIPIYQVEKSTFDEFKNAGLFFKDYDSSQLKIGIHIPQETEHETTNFNGIFLDNRIRRSVIVICLAPYPNNYGYKFRNPYGIHEIPSLIAYRISGVKTRLNGHSKPVASKVSMQNCSTDEAILRHEKESALWEAQLYERLGALQNFHNFFKQLAELVSDKEDPWHHVPVHFVREKTFQKFVDNNKFYRYCNAAHAKIGIAMSEDTADTRYLLLQQRRKRQCFMPSEIIEHERFSDIILLVCIPPIPKWPILKWD